VGDFRKLDVLTKAHVLALDVYKSTASFPRDETFGLTSQARRAAASIGSNLAEGSGRDSDRELARIALGSASELEYQLLLARDLGFLSGDDWVRLSAQTREVQRMLAALARRLASYPTPRA
jgi:four helix bundle protein